MTTLRCGRFELDLSRARVMGVLNLTPDSFSDGGRFASSAEAVAAAWRMVEEGADLVDVGAESSRPGAAPLPLADELARLGPVLAGLRDLPVPVSVDTYKPEVMRRALAEGASMINDIWGLRQALAVDAVARSDCALCVMHMQGDPVSMQRDPVYADVVGEVGAFLRGRVDTLAAAGVAASRLVVDPGFGFGKTVEQNVALLAGLAQIAQIGPPVLVGLSRKSMLGALTGRAVGERLPAGIAAALAAVARGARIVRVHDVAATVDALKVWEMVENRGSIPANPGSTRGEEEQW